MTRRGIFPPLPFLIARVSVILTNSGDILAAKPTHGRSARLSLCETLVALISHGQSLDTSPMHGA